MGQIIMFRRSKRSPKQGPSQARSSYRLTRRFGLPWLALLAIVLFLVFVPADGFQRLFGLEQGIRFWASSTAKDVSGPARVVDGDTLEIAGRKVRLLDMDAPEGKQTCNDHQGKPYRCGDTATAHLRRLIGTRPVTCKGSKRDRYRRLLAICYVGNIDLGREMVRAGHAVPYKRGTGRYNLQANEARKARRGMWQGPICDPFDWRKGRC